MTATMCRTCGFTHPEPECPRWPATGPAPAAPANIVAGSTCPARSGEAWCDRPAGHTGDHDNGCISWPAHATLDDVTAESIRKILGSDPE